MVPIALASNGGHSALVVPFGGYLLSASDH